MRAAQRGALAWYITSRELRHPIPPPSPGSQLPYLTFTPRGIASTTPYSQGSQNSLSVQPKPLRESLDRFNQRSFETSQSSYGHPGCNLNLNLVRLFRLSLFLCLFLPLFGHISFSLVRAALNLQPPSHTELYQKTRSSAAVLQSPVMPNTRRSLATQSVHSFSPAHVVPRSLALLWSPMRSSAPDHNNLLVRTVDSTLSHPFRWGGISVGDDVVVRRLALGSY